MNPFEGLLYGFSVCFIPSNLLAVLVGVLTGTLIGVLPGIGPVGTMAILLPMTLSMGPTAAIIMLAGIYYGAMYGGSTTSILINVPGESTSVVTAVEGYEMAKKGRAGAALAAAAVGSWVAGTLGILGLMLFAPTLAKVALSFGPPEFFTIALLGLFTLSRISGGPLWQSMLVLSLGLGMATVGMDTISATVRFTYSSLQLSQGINIIPVVMGLFGIAEVLSVAERAGGLPQVLKVKFRELFPTRSEWRRALPAMFRGTGVGFFWGLIPGPSTVLSTFASYNLERRISKHKDEFGKGAIEGVAGPEAANNAAQAGTMVPLLSMGIPFTPGAAMLLAGLMMQGIRTGPLLIVERPEVFWGVVASMYLGNLALLVLNLPLVGMWVSVLRIPQSILLTLIMLLTLVGAYSVNNSALDLVVLVGTGIIGYVFRKLKLDIAPMVVALVIGPMLEESFRQSLFISRGDPLIFFQRPISGAILMILVLIMIAPVLWRGLRSRLEKLPSD